MARKKTRSLYDQFVELDERLATRGVPTLGAWWRSGIKRYLDAYERGEVLELHACVGRGSGKSTAIYKLCLFFVLCVRWDVPTGERHSAIILSRLKDEAAKGLEIIAQWLRLLGVKFHTAGDVLELVDLPLAIRVVAKSVAATSGWRAIAVFKDERGKWGASGIEEQDAEEIDVSAAAMTATHARAPIIAMGSAWGAFGSFFDAIMGGDSPGRVVLGPAATWIATDDRVTEAECRAKCRSKRMFQREYMCIFQGSATAAFDLERLRACIEPGDDFMPDEASPPIVVQDPSGGSENAFAFCVFQWGFARSAPLSPKLRMTNLHAITDAKSKGLTAEAIAGAVVRTARSVGASWIFSDQHASWTWKSLYGQRNMKFRDYAWTNPTKGDAVTRLRELIDERVLSIEPGPEADALIAEAALFEERLTPSGNATWGAAKGNDDRISLLLLIARLDSETRVKGSPILAGQGAKVLILDQKKPNEPDDERTKTELNRRGPANITELLGFDSSKVEVTGFVGDRPILTEIHVPLRTRPLSYEDTRTAAQVGNDARWTAPTFQPTRESWTEGFGRRR